MIRNTKIKRRSGSKKKFAALITAVAVLLISALVIVYLYRLSYELQYPLPHYDIVKKYSQKYNVEAPLIYAIIKAESNFQPNVKSEKGAMGLMQVTPDTGAWIAKKMNITSFDPQSLNDPDTNIEFGCWYINWMESQDGLNYGQNRDVIIAAYNSGHNKVSQWLANSDYSKDGKTLDTIPYKETRNYVERVNKYYDIYEKRLEGMK